MLTFVATDNGGGVGKRLRQTKILLMNAYFLAVRKLWRRKAGLQKQAIQRTAELEASNRELEAFSYTVSHELRLPLTAITGYTELLLKIHRGKFQGEPLEYIREIQRAATRMNELIEALLSFACLSRQPLVMSSVNLADLTREVIDELSRREPERKIAISIGELPDIVGDPVLLKQVFVNLLSNAYKFTRGTNNAVVEIGSILRAGERIYFVRDNGAGFDMRNANMLFAAFQRLHRADQFEGSGIGLAIVQHIIQRHGGRIWAEAEVRKGATFSFTLRMLEAGKTNRPR